MELKTDIQYLKGVGEKRAQLLRKLGVYTVGDLLHFYPRSYEDWSQIVSIEDARIGEVCCVRAIVDRKPVGARIRQGLTLYKTDVTDGRSIMQITIFNNRFLADKLEAGEEYLFYGRVGGSLWKKEMNTPLAEKAEGGKRIRPIYRQTEGMTSRTIERLEATALDGCVSQCPETLPAWIRDKYCLCAIENSLRDVHFPPDMDYASHARRRLMFEELLTLTLGMRLLRGRNRARTSFRVQTDETARFIEKLPFRLTNAQRRAIEAITADMAQDAPMNRLLQGDVGSGKTVVAAAAVYNAVQSGMQCALMAPTEILAMQHFETMRKFFAPFDLRVALLTGSTRAAEKKKIYACLQAGEIDLLVGTHALLTPDVTFRRLGLVITDEQHRFGVEQRAALGKKGEDPHILVMSATPIPRTLALMIYGDLDVSVLDELPPGRKPVRTYAVTGEKRERALGYVRDHLDRGLQGYIVCPLVEEGETPMAAAEEYAAELRSGAFRDYNVGLLHGRMRPKEKEAVMRAFASGEVRLLVSTTVIEVGVDVPNAVIMVIENAERFGLSQLHQLRGRIGRGRESSTCILISDAQNDEALRRLRIMTQTNDGFRIADEDLRMRGPGDFFGARQHGLPELKIADLVSETQLVHEAGACAEELLRRDPDLSEAVHRPLRAAVETLWGGVGSSGMN